MPKLWQIDRMKTQRDPRHQHRMTVMQLLYSLEFQTVIPKDTDPLVKETVEKILINKETINKTIDSYAKSFTSTHMSKLDLAVLQLGVFELLYARKEPYRVIVDEAIELAKEFGSENSQKFINGILGNLVEKEIKPHEQH